MRIKIEPNEQASQRTKNRIKERGPWFVIERKHDSQTLGLIGKGDTESWLFAEVDFPDGDRWTGWLPANEFNIVETQGFWAWQLNRKPIYYKQMMKQLLETIDTLVMPLTFFIMMHLVVLYIILPLIILAL